MNSKNLRAAAKCLCKAGEYAVNTIYTLLLSAPARRALLSGAGAARRTSEYALSLSKFFRKP